ncbi:RnfABCDGE type electron transport complex subunit A [bacterium]|nr:RnfABCDGE type electron transport complex subunit A [bacterium]
MSFNQIIFIIFSSMLLENVILSQFLGICSFLGVSKSRKSAVGMGLAVVAVIFIATLVTWLIYNYILVLFDLVYLKTIVFILVIASLVQIIEIIIKKFVPSLYKSLGIYLPLITTNCAVLGVAIKAAQNNLSFFHMLLYALGSGLGFLLIMFIFSFIREELEKRKVPKAMKGIPIALVVASILAIIFSRYVGIVKEDEGEKEKTLPRTMDVITMKNIPSEKYFEDTLRRMK